MCVCVLVHQLHSKGQSLREQWHLFHSLLVFSHFCYPQANWALPVLIPSEWVCVCCRTLWVSPTNFPVKLGVPPAASTPSGVFSQRFEALFLLTGSLSCMVCLAPQLFLPSLSACEYGTVHSTSCCLACPGPPPATLPQVFTVQLPVSAPPPGLDESFFFNSLIVRLPYSSIFCLFWFVFVLKFVVFLWLCKEAQCVYLCLHLGRKSVVVNIQFYVSFRC